MAEKAGISDRTGAWHGRISNANPHMLPPGAGQECVNARLTVSGQFDVRQGVRPLTFGNETTASTAEVVSVYNYPRPEAPFTVYAMSDGTVKAGRNPV